MVTRVDALARIAPGAEIIVRTRITVQIGTTEWVNDVSERLCTDDDSMTAATERTSQSHP